LQIGALPVLTSVTPVDSSRTASSHPAGVVNDRVPEFAYDPMADLVPSLGLYHEALTEFDAVIFAILTEIVVEDGQYAKTQLPSDERAAAFCPAVPERMV
jgi:hypothetical protein